MAEVAAVVKVFPEDAGKINELKKEIAKLKPKSVVEEEVGFGVKLLRVTLVLQDEEGGDIEEKVKKIKGVSEAQVESVTRL